MSSEDERFEKWWEESHIGRIRATPGGPVSLKDMLEESWNAALESVWQPIETAPKDGERILATWVHTWEERAPHIEVCEFDDNHWFYTYDGDSPIEPPTHWIPLPDPPKGG